MKRKQIKAGGQTLRVPFYVDVLELSERDIKWLMESLREVLGASYFRTLALSREVLDDYIERSKEVSWSKAYLHVWVGKDDNLRVGAANKVEDGTTVHSADTVFHVLKYLEAAQIRQREEEIEGLIDSNFY